MTEEIKNEEVKECKCDKKALKIFLLNILGSFLGCLVALCVFSAAVKPQLPPPPQMPCPRMEQPGFHHQFGKRPEGMRNFEGKRFEKRIDVRQIPPEFQKPETK